MFYINLCDNSWQLYLLMFCDKLNKANTFVRHCVGAIIIMKELGDGVIIIYDCHSSYYSNNY